MLTSTTPSTTIYATSFTYSTLSSISEKMYWIRKNFTGYSSKTKADAITVDQLQCYSMEIYNTELFESDPLSQSSVEFTTLGCSILNDLNLFSKEIDPEIEQYLDEFSKLGNKERTLW